MFRATQAVMVLVLAAVLTVGWWSVASAADPPANEFSPETLAKALRILAIAFVVAVLLESGLAVLFNWRPFLLLFDARGVRTIISVIFAYIFVTAFDLDIVRYLVAAYSNLPQQSEFGSRLISALIMAGGSGGVNKMLVALGFRQIKTAEQVVSKPEPTHAWISVALTRIKAKGPVDVHISRDGNVVVAAGEVPEGERAEGGVEVAARQAGQRQRAKA